MALPRCGSGAHASGAVPPTAPMVLAMTEALSSLAGTFKDMGVSRAYGPTVTVDGEELIPVALVSFGFGGGGTSEPVTAGKVAGGIDDGGNGDGAAAGGGGGGFVFPLGAYCRGRHGQVVFRPNSSAVLAGLVPLVWAVGFSVRGVLRTLQRR